ncbi:hypothetical protein D3C73_1422310 [compost metagenome]
MLKHHPHPSRHLLDLLWLGIDSVVNKACSRYPDASPVDLLQMNQAAQHRTLTGTRRTDDRNNVVLIHFKRDLLQHL